MKLYYYPIHLLAGIAPLPLYTQAQYALMDESNRENLRELDEETILEIGDRPCRFMKPRTQEEITRSVEQARARLKEWIT